MAGWPDPTHRCIAHHKQRRRLNIAIHFANQRKDLIRHAVALIVTSDTEVLPLGIRVVPVPRSIPSEMSAQASASLSAWQKSFRQYEWNSVMARDVMQTVIALESRMHLF